MLLWFWRLSNCALLSEMKNTYKEGCVEGVFSTEKTTRCGYETKQKSKSSVKCKSEWIKTDYHSQQDLQYCLNSIKYPVHIQNSPDVPQTSFTSSNQASINNHKFNTWMRHLLSLYFLKTAILKYNWYTNICMYLMCTVCTYCCWILPSVHWYWIESRTQSFGWSRKD